MTKISTHNVSSNNVKQGTPIFTWFSKPVSQTKSLFDSNNSYKKHYVKKQNQQDDHSWLLLKHQLCLLKQMTNESGFILF